MKPNIMVLVVSLLIAVASADAARRGGGCGNAACQMCYGMRYYQQPEYRVVAPKATVKKAVVKRAPVKRKARPNPKAPTPQTVVVAMLELAGVAREDKLVDLGCGDGRIVVTAALRYGCRAGGHDTDPRQVRLALENVRRNGVGRLVNIGRNDVMDLDIGMCSVVTVYLPSRTIGKLMPKFERELRPGSRIVSHNHPLPGVLVDRAVTVRDAGRAHRLYLYVTPLRIDFGMVR